jgi:predicted nucleic acid-binding protein
MEGLKRTNDKQVVFVDADAFVAIAREDDANSERALSLLNGLSERPVQFVTSNYVFSESITVISQRLSHQAALAFIDEIKSPSSQFLIHLVGADTEEMAIKVFREQTSKNVSFVDCTNMAFMRINGVEHIFSFDKVYRQNGFSTVEDLLNR